MPETTSLRNTESFVPVLENVICFICGEAYPRYRLFPDVRGTPRLIDTKTIPCDDCLAQCREFEDDGK